MMVITETTKYNVYITQLGAFYHLHLCTNAECTEAVYPTEIVFCN